MNPIPLKSMQVYTGFKYISYCCMKGTSICGPLKYSCLRIQARFNKRFSHLQVRNCSEFRNSICVEFRNCNSGIAVKSRIAEIALVGMWLLKCRTLCELYRLPTQCTGKYSTQKNNMLNRKLPRTSQLETA